MKSDWYRDRILTKSISSNCVKINCLPATARTLNLLEGAYIAFEFLFRWNWSHVPRATESGAKVLRSPDVFYGTPGS